jgi:hypothetical protein
VAILYMPDGFVGLIQQLWKRTSGETDEGT